MLKACSVPLVHEISIFCKNLLDATGTISMKSPSLAHKSHLRLNAKILGPHRQYCADWSELRCPCG
jgi:hypothetical protein